MVAPAFQWFRSRLIQHKYGDGGNNLNSAALSQLNGLTNDNMIVLGTSRSKTPVRKMNSSHSIASGQLHESLSAGPSKTRAFQNGFKS